jgi:methyltransferase (TIGR00027 family)
MNGPSIQHVSDTAFLVAYLRAVESARPDALFHDPLAARIAGEKGKAIAETFTTRRMTGWNVAIRTVIIDDFIRSAIANGVDTVLNLGAGLDTRPYRLDLPPDLAWVEVDYPDVIAFKDDLLRTETPRCRLERVGLDLADPTSRHDFLARIDADSGRILVLTEGVVPYLDIEQAAALSDDLRALSRVDSWIIDYFSPEALAYRERTGMARQMEQAPFKFRPADWFGFFASHGWRPRQIRYLPEEGARLGRPAPLPWNIRLLRSLFRFFKPAQRSPGAGKFVGYVLLEPAPVPPSVQVERSGLDR